MKLVARVFALAALVCLVAGGAAADEPKRRSASPASDFERANWRSIKAVELESVAGDLAPLLREYGSQGAEQTEYRVRSSQSKITAYVMQDRSGAYGAFTLLRGNGQPVTLGEAGVRTADGFLFYQGNHLVVTSGGIKLDSLATLAGELRARNKEQASLPSLPEYLPEGRIAGSDAYVLGPLGLERVAPLGPGDWAGFAYGAEAEVARYQRESKEVHLVILSYPTPQIARARMADFQQIFNLNLEGRPNAPVAFARRKGSLVVLVSGLSSKETAEQLIGQVRFEPQLSWSDPQSEEAAATVSGLLNLMLGTALLVLLTLGLSLAFAGLRLGLKVWFPGRFFDKAADEGSLFLDIRPRR